MFKFVVSLFVLFMTVYVVYSADAVIEDEDENTNPKVAAPVKTPDTVDADDYVPSEDEAAEEEEDAEKSEQAAEETPVKKDADEAIQWDGKTIELTGDNFDANIDKFEALLVMIYAPWCGHCKDFFEDYQEVGQQLFDNSPRYFAAKIDGYKYKEIFLRYDAPGFPHFVFFKRGKPIKYDEKKKIRPLVDFVKKHGPEIVQRLDCGQLIEQKRRQTQLVVYFGPSEAHSKFLMVEAMARRETRFSFFWNDEPECWEKHNVEPKTVTFMSNFDSEGFKMHEYKNSSKVGLFAEWLVEPQIPPIVMYDTSISKTIRSVKKPCVILFRPEEDEFEDYAGVYKRAAMLNRGKAIFVWADKEEEEGADLAKHMKVTEYALDPMGPVYPSIRVMWIYPGTRFISQIKPRKHTVESITQFLDDVLSGEHEEFLPSTLTDPYMKHRFVPEISGRQFQSVVSSDHEDYGKKDLVIYYYSPDCPHCKNFNPKYVQIARYFASRPNIKFMVINAVQNQVKGINVSRFPNVQFWPMEIRGKNLKTAKPFVQVAEDSRDPDTIMAWLVSNSKALKDEEVTIQMLVAEKNQSDAIYNQTEFDLNMTIKADEDAKTQAILDKEQAKLDAIEKQQEQAARTAEQEEQYQKLVEEKKKRMYGKKGTDAASEEEERAGESSAPSQRIPGKKKKPQPGDKKYDDEGNEMFEVEMPEGMQM